jgi:coenzyme F420-reducing hydrogenase delta subunit
MCSGRVDPAFAIEALRGGTDGVMILGCHLNDCHYIDGNYEEEIKFFMLKKLLEIAELDNRVVLDWVSAAEGVRFAKIVQEFTDLIKSLGPSPIKGENNESLLEKMEAIGRVVNDPRIRTLVGRERNITTQENVYGKIVDREFYDQILEQAIQEEYVCQRMLISMEAGPKSVKNLAKELDLSPKIILRYVTKLRGNGLIDLHGIENVTPSYKLIKI